MAGENLFLIGSRQGIKSEFAFHLLKGEGGETQQLSKNLFRGVRMFLCACFRRTSGGPFLCLFYFMHSEEEELREPQTFWRRKGWGDGCEEGWPNWKKIFVL